MLTLMKREVIYRDQRQGGQRRPLFVRFVLFQSRWLSLFLHQFRASDTECPHDHPWWYVSWLLWGGGYREQTFAPSWTRTEIVRSRYYPSGSVLVRQAEHVHRVLTLPGTRPVTLVLTGPVVRPWGFWTPLGWVWARIYDLRRHCPEEDD